MSNVDIGVTTTAFHAYAGPCMELSWSCSCDYMLLQWFAWVIVVISIFINMSKSKECMIYNIIMRHLTYYQILYLSLFSEVQIIPI